MEKNIQNLKIGDEIKLFTKLSVVITRIIFDSAVLPDDNVLERVIVTVREPITKKYITVIHKQSVCTLKKHRNRK